MAIGAAVAAGNIFVLRLLDDIFSTPLYSPTLLLLFLVINSQLLRAARACIYFLHGWPIGPLHSLAMDKIKLTKTMRADCLITQWLNSALSITYRLASLGLVRVVIIDGGGLVALKNDAHFASNSPLHFRAE